MASFLLLAILLAGLPRPGAAQVPKSERLMLLGSGPDDAVPWLFRIDGGMRAGEEATIHVPSNWQQQRFGHYQYGYDRGPRSTDRGVYRRMFDVPAGWKNRTVRFVFDGVMTDATVKVNGQLASPTHQGGFNRFSYDVTRLLKMGTSNEIEVDVRETSAARDTDIAERWGGYWVFGGIYRPGYYDDLKWLRLDSRQGSLVICNEGPARFLQLGARQADLPTTSVDFPAAELGFMQAIPAMGAKGQPASLTGPAGQPDVATGDYSGRLLFNLLSPMGRSGRR